VLPAHAITVFPVLSCVAISCHIMLWHATACDRGSSRVIAVRSFNYGTMGYGQQCLACASWRVLRTACIHCGANHRFVVLVPAAVASSSLTPPAVLLLLPVCSLPSIDASVYNGGAAPSADNTNLHWTRVSHRISGLIGTSNVHSDAAVPVPSAAAPTGKEEREAALLADVDRAVVLQLWRRSACTRVDRVPPAITTDAVVLLRRAAVRRGMHYFRVCAKEKVRVSCRVVSCRVVSCRVVSCRVVSCRALSYPVVSCRVLSCPVVSCRVLSGPVVSCRVLPCPVVSCRVLSCPVVSRRVALCPVVPCRVLSCPVASRRIVSCRISGDCLPL
jgi:hypothetical protein